MQIGLTGGFNPSAPDERHPQLQYAEWSDQLELGIPLIDEQHRRFFDLAASFTGNGDGVRVMKTLVILSDYIRSHLRDEEALMKAAKYPGLEEHCRLHADFRRMLANLLGRARQMSLDEIAEEVKYLINGWFYQHIVTVDFEYAPYLVLNPPSHPHAPPE
ncbi:bacteriohemerythrin [Georgfuchsia toluolica]|nr:hemerythrin family protein [Georgfuchsia toluolica]